MANYTIYHPSWEHHAVLPRDHNSYCTEVLAYAIKEELTRQGHSVYLNYIRLYTDDIYRHRLIIEELDIDSEIQASTLWMIISNDDTKKFSIIDLQDSPAATYQLKTHPNLVFSLVGQYSLERYKFSNMFSPHQMMKLIPFVYTAYVPAAVELLTEEIQDIRNSTPVLDDRVFFYGNNRDAYMHERQKIREVITVLAEKYPDETCVGSWEAKLPREEFFRKAATHTINLGLPGHPWCSREHELWTLGLPVMLYEHTHHVAVDLLPNYHYVAVPVGARLDIGMAKNPEVAADSIMQYHREWIKPENRWKLNNIAKHGQIRMLQRAQYSKLGPLAIELLQLGHW